MIIAFCSLQESLIEATSRNLNSKKKKILIKSPPRSGTRSWYKEKRGWVKVVKRKMDNRNNNLNINSDKEKGFKRKNGLTTNGRLNSCPECDYSTDKYNLWKRHQMSHLPVKRLKCPHCSFSTNFNSYLLEHSVIHSNHRPFKCSYCDFASKLKGNLKKHEKTHLKISNRLSVKKQLCDIKANTFNSEDSPVMKKLKKNNKDSMVKEKRFINPLDEQGDMTKETSSQPPLDDSESILKHRPSLRKENSVKKRKLIRNVSKSLKSCKRVKGNPSSADETQENVKNFVSKKFICSECKLTSGIRRIIVRHVRQKHKGNETLISVVEVEGENNNNNNGESFAQCKKNLKNNLKPEDEKDLDTNNAGDYSVNSFRNESDTLSHDENLSTTVKQNLVPSKTIQERSLTDFNCDINHHPDLKTNCRVVVKLRKLSNLPLTNANNYDNSGIINQNGINKFHKEAETTSLDQEVQSQSLRLKYSESEENLNGELTTGDETLVKSSKPKRTNLRNRESVLQSSPKSINEGSEESSNIFSKGMQSPLRSCRPIKSPVKNKNRKTKYNARNRKKIKLHVDDGNALESNENINIDKTHSQAAKLESNIRDINREEDDSLQLQIQKERGLIHNDNIQGILSPLPSGVSNNETTMTGNGEKAYPPISGINCGNLVANTYNANCDNISLFNHNDSILNSSNLSSLVSEKSDSLDANLNGNLNDRADDKLNQSPISNECSTSDSVTSANSLSSSKLKRIRMLVNHVGEDETLKEGCMDDIQSKNVDFKRNLRSKPVQVFASDGVKETENKFQQSTLKVESNLARDTPPETNNLNVPCAKINIISEKFEDLSSKPEDEKSKTTLLTKSSTLNGESLSPSKKGAPFQKVHLLLNCPHCSYSSNSKFLLEKHKRSHSTLRNKKRSPSEPLKKYSRTKTKIQDDTSIEIQPKYQCPHCEYSTSTKADLESHTLIHKTTDKNAVSKGMVKKLPHDIICKKCKVTFTIKSSLNRHFRRKHGGINVNDEDDKKDITAKEKSTDQVSKPQSCTLSNKCRVKKKNLKVPNKAPKLVQNRKKKK